MAKIVNNYKKKGHSVKVPIQYSSLDRKKFSIDFDF